jgi:hypothetical protein
MTDYHSPTVVQPTIPNADMTPLERLLLTHIFEAEPDGDGLYFFAEAALSDAFELAVEAVRAALAQSAGIASTASAYLARRMDDIGDSDTRIELDLGGTCWEFIFQDIVRRFHVIEADETLTTLTADAVTDTDIHAACCAVVEHTDLSEERGAAVFRAALAAIREAERRARSI